jgi:hypothetical protein
MPPIIDIYTHCSPPRPPGDRFGVQEALRGMPAGRNVITNYRGLPAVSYYEMGDFELEQAACAKAGVTPRLISTPFGHALHRFRTAHAFRSAQGTRAPNWPGSSVLTLHHSTSV